MKEASNKVCTKEPISGREDHSRYKATAVKDFFLVIQNFAALIKIYYDCNLKVAILGISTKFLKRSVVIKLR